MLRGHLASVTVHLQQFPVLKETAGVSNAHRGRYAAFASERGCVLKNRALLDDEPGHSREQRREMWMENPDNENRTCRNGHDVFDVAYHVGLSAGTSRRGGQACVDYR